MSEDREPRSGLPEGLTDEVRTLIELMGRGGIVDLRLDTPNVQIRLRGREGYPSAGNDARPAHWPETTDTDVAGAIPAPAGHLITAPMIGAFYHAASPGDPPFVNVGDAVEVGQTVGIIEAMKIMNEITADIAGTVAEIYVQNGQPVEYGQPLLRLAPPTSM